MLAVAVGTVTWSAVNFRSTRDALLYLKGARLVIEPVVVSVGQGRAGETRGGSFEVRDLASTPVVVLGSSTTCSCAQSETLPLTVAPGGTTVVHVSMALDGKPRDTIAPRLTFYTDSRADPQFSIQVIGKIADR